ncbi:MAG: ABC transporter ATP-binding protein [bacterium]
MIRTENLSFGYSKQKIILNNVTIGIDQPGIYSVIGLNGAGKSTLLKLLAGILKPSKGKVLLGSNDIADMNYSELSTHRSYLPQNVFLPVDFPVIDFIRYGAYAEMDIFSRISAQREKTIHSVMEEMNLLDLKNRMTSTLSAGEMQRIHIAKALVQGGKLILMDEPVSTIDVSFRKKFITIMRKLAVDRIVILVTHDLQLAFGLSKRIICVGNGSIIADDSPEKTIHLLEGLYRERIPYIIHDKKFIFIDEEEM